MKLLKLIYSEKAKENFVGFSEYMNFNKKDFLKIINRFKSTKKFRQLFVVLSEYMNSLFLRAYPLT